MKINLFKVQIKSICYTFVSFFFISNITLVNIAKGEQYLSNTASKQNSKSEYKGPQVESRNIEIIYSENAILKAKIIAKVGQQFKNKDMLYPKGLLVYFYNDRKEVKGTLKADLVKFNYKKNIYEFIGNVVLINPVKQETLETQYLTWLPNDKKITTESFISIKTKDVKLIGKGLDADEDLTNYTIMRPKGIMKIKKQSTLS